MSAFVVGIVDFLQLRLGATGCRRRNPSQDQTFSVTSERDRTFLKPKPDIPVPVYPDSNKRACHDQSNDSTDDPDLAALSTDGSDRETTSSQTLSADSRPTDSPSTSAPSVRFVKAQPKPANETWKHVQGRLPTTMEAIRRKVLSDVMSKLSSEDADILKSIFDDKQDVAAASTASTSLDRTRLHDLGLLQRRRRFQPTRKIRCHQASTPVGDENALRSNLRRMATINEKCVVLVKRISKLGMNPSLLLEKYFSRFGSVEEVVCAHPIDKRAGSGKPRARPANTGFVVFVKSEDAAAAIRNGSEQVVSGVSISVGACEHHWPKDAHGRNGG